jgi:hypothetical protein
MGNFLCCYKDDEYRFVSDNETYIYYDKLIISERDDILYNGYSNNSLLLSNMEEN